MNYNKKTVYDIDVVGKKVLLRCDFNVPQDKATGAITSDKRIVAALPTIRYLLGQGAAVIACSHLGKPEPSFEKWVKKQTEKGKDPAELTEEKWQKSLKKLTLAPVAERLSELLGKPVIFAHDVVGPDAKAKAAALKGGEIMLLENTRFEKGETKNDPALAKELASMAEVYVSDAFGSVHRAHASTAGVAAYLPAVSGLLVAKELEVMGKALDDPKRPFVAVLGGAKVSDKIAVINNLLEKADTVIIGGGMAYTFAKAQGGEIGKSLLEEDKCAYALEMIEKAKAKGVKLLLPVDTVAAKEFAADAEPVVVDAMIPYARISGLPQLPRESVFHALNQKAIARRYARETGRKYEELNLIVSHMGGGITVSAHRQGRVIDTSNALNGAGPFSPERAGTLPPGPLIDLCFSGEYTREELQKLINGRGGLLAHLGTTSVPEILRRIDNNDLQAMLVLRAMCYNVAKEIGAMAIALKGKADAILLTGGIAHNKRLTDFIAAHVDFIAPVFVYPGENELEALARNALAVLRGDCEAKTYYKADVTA